MDEDKYIDGVVYSEARIMANAMRKRAFLQHHMRYARSERSKEFTARYFVNNLRALLIERAHGSPATWGKTFGK